MVSFVLIAPFIYEGANHRKMKIDITFNTCLLIPLGGNTGMGNETG